jgi:hypothetical protein
MTRGTAWTLALALIAGIGCSPDRLTREQLYDPSNCTDCHERHVTEWQMSMHAYAADDPVFLAMNRRGQEETNGELGTFCVNCHAPLAVRLGEMEDGLELEDPDFPAYLRGVNCAFCHLAVHDGEEESNNPIELANGRRLFGPFDDPTKSPAHDAAYSPLLDRDRRESTDLCGPCHDIVLDNGVHLEQTFAEWKETVFATPEVLSTCGNCHMRASDESIPIADYEGVPARKHHDHRMPGIDVAITPWPGREEYTAAVQAFLETTVRSDLCVDPEGTGFRILLGLENVAAGHSFPSGSSQDRRVWAEVRAWDGDELLFETGVVPDETPAVDIINAENPGVLLRDRIFKANGDVAHMFWDVAADPERDVLNGIRQFGFEEVRQWEFLGPAFTAPDRVELRIYERPIGLDVLDDLIETGHLDPALRPEMPRFELTGARLEWTGPTLGTCVSSDRL